MADLCCQADCNSVLMVVYSLLVIVVIKILNSKMIIFAKILFSLKTFIACNCITP